jgi:hypothetical protein
MVEPSFLVFGLPLETAGPLGKKLVQNAIVWYGADAVLELILLRYLGRGVAMLTFAEKLA